jgi:hypothetical protein
MAIGTGLTIPAPLHRVARCITLGTVVILAPTSRQIEAEKAGKFPRSL